MLIVTNGKKASTATINENYSMLSMICMSRRVKGGFLLNWSSLSSAVTDFFLVVVYTTNIVVALFKIQLSVTSQFKSIWNGFIKVSRLWDSHA